MDDANTGTDLPKYRCHKEVWALKIKSVAWADSEPADYDPATCVRLNAGIIERQQYSCLTKLSVPESSDAASAWHDVLEGIKNQRFPWRGDWLLSFVNLSDEIAACGDESGIHDAATRCLLAGYIGSVKQWILFDERWERVLDAFDVLDFHSKEFFAFHDGERVGHYFSRSNRTERRRYRDWSNEHADRFISGLLNIIDTTNIHPIGAMVDAEAFRALTYGERKLLTGGVFDGQRWRTSGAPSRPYHLVYDHCLIEAAQRTKAGKKLLFIFDQQKTFESRALQQFQDAVATGPPLLRVCYRGVLFESRIEVSGLQAADLYAHCWHRYATDQNRVGEYRLKALDVLTNRVQGMKFYTAGHMELILSQLPPEVRARIRATSEPNITEEDSEDP